MSATEEVGAFLSVPEHGLGRFFAELLVLWCHVERRPILHRAFPCVVERLQVAIVYLFWYFSFDVFAELFLEEEEEWDRELVLETVVEVVESLDVLADPRSFFLVDVLWQLVVSVSFVEEVCCCGFLFRGVFSRECLPEFFQE